MATIVETPLARRGSDNKIIGRSGKPLLVIVEGKNIDAMIDAGLAAIGGIGTVVGDNKHVLLKPNTNQRDPFPSITDPATMRAVARHLYAAGVENITVHEDHKREPELYFSHDELPNMDIQQSHSPTVDDYVLVEHTAWQGDADPETAFAGLERRGMLGRLLEGEFRATEGPRLRVARQLQEAAVIINMPVLKRHFAGQITSALKNHFGSVYGPQRWLGHISLENNRDYFDRKLAEFASAVRPELTITDARSLQAVAGPGRSEDTRIVDGVDRIIITGDMIAADVVAMELMKKHDETFNATNEAIVNRQHEHAEELGLGTRDLGKLEVIELKA